MDTTVKTMLKGKDARVFTVNPKSTVIEAVELMNKHKIGALVVTDPAGCVSGIITERDVLQKVGVMGDIKHVKVTMYMTPAEKLVVADESYAVQDILNIMTEKRIRHIPIVEEGCRLKGMISIGDAVKAVLQDREYEIKLLKDYITG